MSAGQEWILPLVKWVHFFLGPWLLVCQFVEISNQMESNGKVSNLEQIFLYNTILYKKILFKAQNFSPLSHSNSRGPPPRDGQWGPDIRRRTSMVQARLQSPDIVRRRKFGPAERTFSSSLVQNFKFLPTGGAQLTLVLESWRHTILGASLRTRLQICYLLASSSQFPSWGVP